MTVRGRLFVIVVVVVADVVVEKVAVDGDLAGRPVEVIVLLDDRVAVHQSPVMSLLEVS